MVNYLNETPTKHPELIKWVEGWAELCKPNGVYWCDGTLGIGDGWCGG